MSDIVIQKLEYPNNVRFKASMYLGDTTTPTTAIREIIDNSLDEAMNGFADKVIINIDDNTFWNSSLDNGRGIPIYKDTDKDGDEEITTDIFSKLHSGGKFEANLVSIGTFGIGSAATNAVSDDFIAVINIPNNTNTREKPEWIKEGISKGDDTYLLHFKRGIFHNKFTSKYQEVREYLLGLGVKEYQIPDDFSSWSSFVLCKPDSTIFSSLKSKYKERELQLQKMLNPNIDLQFNGKQVEIFDITKDSFKQTQFFNDKVFSLTVDYEAPYEYHGQSRTSKNRFIVAFGYSQNDFSTVTDGSVNTLDTPDGYHVSLANRLLQKSFKDIFPDMEAKDATYGLRLFCLVMTNASEYTSQDKVRLGRIYGINEADLQSLFKRELIKIVNENKEYFESLCLRINEYKATIGTLSQKNFVKSVVIYGDDKRAKGLGAQVFDCSSKNREECELFICFTGDTTFYDCNATKIRMDEVEDILAKQDIYTYSCAPDGTLVPSKVISGGKTGVNKQIIRVTLDNGEHFRCTPDHKIMMRDGTYKEAKDLNEGESLMPFYTVVEDDDKGIPRRFVKDNKSGRFVLGYRIMSDHKDTLTSIKLQDGDTVQRHHIDFNSLNDYPTNLMFVSDKEHMGIHASSRANKLYELSKQDPNLYARCYGKNRISEQGKINISNSMKARMTEEEKKRLSELSKKQWASEELREWRRNKTIEQLQNNKEDCERGGKTASYNMTINSLQKIREHLVANNLELTSENFDNSRREIGLSPLECKTFNNLINNPMYSDLLKEYSITRPQSKVEKLLREILPQLSEVTKECYTKTLVTILGKKNGSQLGSIGYKHVYKQYSHLFEEEIQKRSTYNHKVTKVEILTEKEDVYCIRVDSEYHNFPLSAGVFVHNCEGKSAGGSIVAARDSKIHAVLPLRGKLFNSSNAELEEALNNKEIRSMINCIGVGISPYVDLSKRRYGKVIIACDADVDGCFTGDTKISLLDGTEIEIQELVGREEFWVYSCTPEGEIKPGRGHSARVTKHVDTLYHITLDNGEIIKCTDNHPFMMRDGTYKRADELKEGTPLMSVSTYNHEITKIEVVKLDKSIPVYDITVDEYHNFALTSGVFVHNCHIQVLVLGAFAKFLPELIEAGMLYLGLAPIYEQKINGQTNYYWLDKLDGFQHNKPFNRYKGLGSCPPKTLRDTLIDPNIRRLIQITPENINEAVSLLQDAYLRRELMVENGIVDFKAMENVDESEVESILRYAPQSLTVEEQELVQQQL